MSAPRRRLRLAPQAELDVQGIRVYGLRQWGEDQARAYQTSLQRGLAMLRNHPRIGAERTDLFPGLRAFPVGRHIIFYVDRVDVDLIDVVRVLHERADPTRHLQP